MSAAAQGDRTTIFRVGRSGELVTTAPIAERLNVVAPFGTEISSHLAAT